MRTVTTEPPSFPAVTPDELLPQAASGRWQVVCGDAGHWRVGVYSPGEVGPGDIRELEQHDCPELFLLQSGEVSLLLVRDGKPEVVRLEAGRPILVQAPHNGFCPNGPHSGVALVVERDRFQTVYRTVDEWVRLSGRTD
ncbi:MAG: hypothetical protein FJ109_17230 [Deltaproteobacteria bacterium]|nr:hypothetical protein [Deltaproteobacteria bacterium]